MWLRFAAALLLTLGVLCAGLVVMAVRDGADLIDWRFGKVLIPGVPPLLLATGLLAWRVSGWTTWPLRVDEDSSGFRGTDGPGRLKPPLHMSSARLARAELLSGPKVARAIEIPGTGTGRAKMAMTALRVGFPRTIPCLQEAQDRAGAPVRAIRTGGFLSEGAVIERDAAP